LKLNIDKFYEKGEPYYADGRNDIDAHRDRILEYGKCDTTLFCIWDDDSRFATPLLHVQI